MWAPFWIAPLMLVLAAAEPAGEQTLELIPRERAGWSAARVFAPVAGLLRGDPGAWYRRRGLRVGTQPPGAAPELFYLRSGFQKSYQQAVAPLRLVLPSRVEAGPRDRVQVRALLQGYRPAETTLSLGSAPGALRIELEPLPNALLALTHVSLAGRASLGFFTREALQLRVDEREGGDLQLVLSGTALGEAAGFLEAVGGSVVAELRARQLGEDLLVHLVLAEAARGRVEVRARRSFDPLRRRHRFSLDLVPRDGEARALLRAREALARLVPGDIGGCSAAWDAGLRRALDPAALARALAPQGEFTDRTLAAAMERLGELSPDGLLRLVDGTRLRAARPIERMAASSSAHEVEGYLAALRGLVRELEPPPQRRETLRGLLAPELAPDAFAAALAEAAAAESACASAVGERRRAPARPERLASARPG